MLLRLIFQLTNKCVEQCGLFVSVEYPYLGASPDGLVGDQEIIEVKCPYTGRYELITPSENFPFLQQSTDDNTLMLKTSHPYYDQVQGELFMSQRNLCHFVVYTLVDIQIVKVNYDEDYFLNSLLPKLDLFFHKHLLPFLSEKL